MKFSELDISSNFLSAASVQTLESQNSSRLLSDIHEYVRTSKNSRNRLIYHCNFCSWSNTVTTNVRKHLLTKHNIALNSTFTTIEIVQDSISELYESLLAQGRAKELDNLNEMILKRTTDNSAAYQSLIDLIIMHRLSFRLIK
jgi:hypothetical protein